MIIVLLHKVARTIIILVISTTNYAAESINDITFGVSCSSTWHLMAGREIAPNTGANATKFFTLATKSWKLVAKLATTTFHHNLTKRYSELNKFAKINPRQTSSLSLFPKRSTCISIDN